MFTDDIGISVSIAIWKRTTLHLVLSSKHGFFFFFFFNFVLFTLKLVATVLVVQNCGTQYSQH